MREFINIIENAEKEDLFARVEAASEKHLGRGLYTSECESFYGTTDPHELVQIIDNDIKNLFHAGTARLHRIINVADDVIENLRAGASLGPLDPNTPASWTTQWTDLEPTALHINMHDDDLYNLFVVEAEVSWWAVDVPTTIAQNIALWWEHEITLLRHKPIKLIGIHRAESYGPAGKEMRPDLRGAQMLS